MQVGIPQETVPEATHYLAHDERGDQVNEEELRRDAVRAAGWVTARRVIAAGLGRTGRLGAQVDGRHEESSLGQTWASYLSWAPRSVSVPD